MSAWGMSEMSEMSEMSAWEMSEMSEMNAWEMSEMSAREMGEMNAFLVQQELSAKFCAIVRFVLLSVFFLAASRAGCCTISKAVWFI